MPDLTYLAKGLNMIGQSYLANKSAQKKIMNQVALEKLKQDSWLRNLQEQNRRYEITQQRILEQHKAEQDRQAKVAEAKSLADLEEIKNKHLEWQQEYNLEDRKIRVLEKELEAKKEGQGVFGKNYPKPRYITELEREIGKLLKKEKQIGYDNLSDSDRFRLENYFKRGQQSNNIDKLMQELLGDSFKSENNPKTTEKKSSQENWRNYLK
ncbi:MAG: hypothetical protein KJ725_20580 [Gammaproteobacteria bacterium]|nr:hypothetical protein [Gammaproteobacteria bacterium]